MTIIPVAAIKIGPRHRQDHGDIAALARSIEGVGLLHPIVIRPDRTLIAGERRLLAFKQLGRDIIPATVIDLEKTVLGEYAENVERKDFTLSEAVAIKRALEPAERAAAKERMVAAHASPGKLPELGTKGNSSDKAAKATGRKRRSLDKAEAIVAAAEAEPEKFGKLQADMDRTGRVDGPFKRLKVIRQSEAIRKEPPPLPQRGPHRVIVVDPPWPYEIDKKDPSYRATHPYPQMSIEQICAVDVPGIAHADCVLWLWTTNRHMREAFTVLDAWGFEHKTILTWAKEQIWSRPVAPWPDRTLHHGHTWEAGRRADESDNAFARCRSGALSKADRVLRLR